MLPSRDSLEPALLPESGSANMTDVLLREGDGGALSTEADARMAERIGRLAADDSFDGSFADCLLSLPPPPTNAFKAVKLIVGKLGTHRDRPAIDDCCGGN